MPENKPVDQSEIKVGGMALQNGLLLQSGRYWAAAVRDDDGKIRVASGEKKRLFGRSGEGRIPLLRGLTRLADNFAVLPRVKASMGEASFPMEGPRMAAALGASALLTAGIRRWGGRSIVGQEGGVALATVLSALVALKNSPIARYHGAEHKSIGEYELEIKGEAAAGATKEHLRCGSNLVAPLILSSAAGNVLLRKTVKNPSPAATLSVGLASIGAAMEVFRWMASHPDSAATRVLSYPGHLLQRFITTEEPSSEQMEVGRTALKELLRLEAAAGE